MPLTPFYQKEIMAYENSLALANPYDVLGWVITHKIDENTIRYTALYLDLELRKKSFLTFYMLAKSIQLHQKTEIKNALFELSMKGAENAWIAFVYKKIAPYAYKTIHHYSKILLISN